MSDELLRRGRALAYRLRQDRQGLDAALIEDLCVSLEQTTRKPEPPRSTVATFDPR